MKMERMKRGRLLAERPAPRDGQERRRTASRVRAARSVTVNLAESPLGWLRSRGHVSERQFAAGEQLRGDWERAGLPPAGDDVLGFAAARPGAARPGGSRTARPTPSSPPAGASTRRSRRSGPGLRDIAWRVVCSGEGMREAETALGWPVRAGKLVLTMALDRLADHYRLR